MHELNILKGQAVKKVGEKVYYFTQEGILRSVDEQTAIKMYENGQLKGCSIYMEDYKWIGKEKVLVVVPKLPKIKYIVLRMEKIIRDIEEGQSLEDLEKEIIKELKKIQPKEPIQNLDYLVTKVEKPIFIKSTPCEKNFDYIYVDMFLTTSWKGDRKKFVKENISDLKKMAVEKLEKDKSFNKYGVPINFFELSRLSYSESKNLIQFVFGLKKLKES